MKTLIALLSMALLLVAVPCFAESELDRLFAQADKALYEAKHNGKNQVRTVHAR